MWTALRDLYSSVPPAHRLTLAIAVGALLVSALGLLAVMGLDLAPFWSFLGGG